MTTRENPAQDSSPFFCARIEDLLKHTGAPIWRIYMFSNLLTRISDYTTQFFSHSAQTGRRSGMIKLTIVTLMLLMASSYVSAQFATPQFYQRPLFPTTPTLTPHGVAVDASGLIYIADEQGAQVLVEKCTGSTCSVVKTFPISTAFLGPTGVAVDQRGDIFIASPSEGIVYEELNLLGLGTYSNYIQSSLDPTLSGPNAVAVDSAGNLFVTASGGTPGVYEEVYSGGIYTQQRVHSTSFTNPTSIAIDNIDNIYVGDGNNIILLTNEFSGPSGYVQSTFSNVVSHVGGVAADGLGDVFASDTSNGVVYEFQERPTGHVIYAVALWDRHLDWHWIPRVPSMLRTQALAIRS